MKDISSFKRLVESRFHFKEDASTLRSMFYRQRQGTDETDADWSERVMSVGHEAFKGLATDFIEDEIVRRFCACLNDKDAAEHVLNSSPRTFEETQHMIRKFEENRKAVHGYDNAKVRVINTELNPNSSFSNRSSVERSPSTNRNKSSNRPSAEFSPGNMSNQEFIQRIADLIDKKIEQRLDSRRIPSQTSKEDQQFKGTGNSDRSTQ